MNKDRIAELLQQAKDSVNRFHSSPETTFVVAVQSLCEAIQLLNEAGADG